MTNRRPQRTFDKAQWWTPLNRAIEQGDAAYLRGYLDGSLGIETREMDVARWLKEAQKWLEEYGPPGCWRMWFKNRVCTSGYLSPGFMEAWHKRLTVLLHVFFIHIDETPEQLQRLAKCDSTSNEKTPKLATPGIERTSVILQPIDATAAKVVGKDD